MRARERPSSTCESLKPDHDQIKHSLWTFVMGEAHADGIESLASIQLGVSTSYAPSTSISTCWNTPDAPMSARLI